MQGGVKERRPQVERGRSVRRGVWEGGGSGWFVGIAGMSDRHNIKSGPDRGVPTSG